VTLSTSTTWLGGYRPGVAAKDAHEGIGAPIHPAISQLGSCFYQGCVQLIGLLLGQVEALGDERHTVPVLFEVRHQGWESVASGKRNGAASLRFCARSLSDEPSFRPADLLNHLFLQEARINRIGDCDQVIGFSAVDSR
jgi:hypothetical protein